VSSQVVPASPPTPISMMNSHHTPAFPFVPLESVRVLSWIVLVETSRALRTGDFLLFSESSGERGEEIMPPKKIGPLGSVSRVGARK